MNEWKDNKLENIFFKIILKNKSLNLEILKIYNLINSQNISLLDKRDINNKVFWFWLINENDEIQKLLKIIRNDNIKTYLLYKIIFELIEDILDIEDIKHIDILLSNTKENVTTDIVYFLRDIFEFIFMNLKEKFNSKEKYYEIFSKDYLNDEEKIKLLEEIDNLFTDIVENIKESKEKNIIKNKIQLELKKKNKLYNIK